MSRWLMYLSQQKLILGDGSGDLSDILTMAPSALDAVEAYLEHALVLIKRLSKPADL